MKKNFFLYVILCLLILNFSFAQEPFPYDLHLTTIPGKNSQAVIVAHGMGGNYKIAELIKFDKTLITFNFPDYDYGRRYIEVDKTKFGTIDEILPLLYVIKKSVITDEREEIDLYGFSAGGGAIINAIGALNTTRFDAGLATIGIFQKEKEQMLEAIQKGLIVLDVPLKSIREIIDFRGPVRELQTIAKRYQQNDMEPIDAIKYLKGLSLHIILHFQNRDEILSNRDDDLFFTRLKKYNENGTTELIVGSDGGHNSIHYSLWNYYLERY